MSGPTIESVAARRSGAREVRRRDPLTGVRTPRKVTYMNTTTAAKARIVTDGDAIDMWATESTDIVATQLRECMVLMDPTTGTPAVWLDHRMPSARRSGNVAWMGHALETGRLVTVQVHENTNLSVLA